MQPLAQCAIARRAEEGKDDQADTFGKLFPASCARMSIGGMQVLSQQMSRLSFDRVAPQAQLTWHNPTSCASPLPR